MLQKYKVQKNHENGGRLEINRETKVDQLVVVIIVPIQASGTQKK
jgi:hypothetical protein